MRSVAHTSGRVSAIRFLPYAVAVAVTALFTIASYPGFMSFDSLEALRQARGAVEGSQYPPFGSYVWRLLDWIWPGPSLMQIMQNGTLLVAFAAILQALNVPAVLQVVAILGFALLPPLTGTMLVVWKDVAVAALYMASISVLFRASLRNDRRRPALVIVGILLLFCGMAYRFNAASGALPMAVYAVWLLLRRMRGPRGRTAALTGGLVLLFALFAMVWFVNSYRFPSMERLERNTNMDSIMRFDLVGISRYSGAPTLSDDQGTPIPADYMKKIYDPRHLNITGMNDLERRLPASVEQIVPAWRNALMSHPFAYVRHRCAVMREYLGMHGHEIFYITHPAVDSNTMNIQHTPNALTARVVAYVWSARAGIMDRSWVYYIFTLVLLVLAKVVGALRYRAEAIMAAASGLLYLAPMFIITPAADLRYNFWSIAACLVSIVFTLTALWLRFVPGRNPPLVAE